MSRRISLTRVVAINWYGFRQIFDVDESVLISGAFGTGKSALLDLMQYVLLGEHWRANRAAASAPSAITRCRDFIVFPLVMTTGVIAIDTGVIIAVGEARPPLGQTERERAALRQRCPANGGHPGKDRTKTQKIKGESRGFHPS